METIKLEDEMREIRREKKKLLMRSDRALASLKRDIGVLNSHLAVKRQGQNDMASLKKQLEELKYEKSRLCEQEMISLRTELEELKQENQSLLTENQDIQHQVVSLGKKLKAVKRATSSLLTSNQDKKQEEDLLKKKIQDLKNELAVLTTQRQLGLQEQLTVKANIDDKECAAGLLLRDDLNLRKYVDLQERRMVDMGTYIADLTQHIADVKNKFYLEQQSALKSCWETGEAEYNSKLHQLKQRLASTKSKLDHMTFQHATACDERSAREAELIKRHIAKMANIVQECHEVNGETEILRTAREKKLEEYEKSLGRTNKPDFKDTHRTQEIMVSPGRLDCLERQATRLSQVEEATRCLRVECEGDIQEWVEERNVYTF